MTAAIHGGSMPLVERDPNISGRNSRTSNISNGSKGHRKHGDHHRHGQRVDLLSIAPGVTGMLRTTTEIGDVGSLAVVSARNSAGHQRGANRRNGTASRMSTGSAPSQSGRRTSRHHVWASVSSAGPRRSIASNITAPPFLEPAPLGYSNMSDSISMIPAGCYPYVRDGHRSFSMTNTAQGPYGFANHRSLTSLRSQEPFPRPRSPYRYPTRLKRPGYRPSSPALSDVTGLELLRVQNQLASRMRPSTGPTPPLRSTRHLSPYLAQRNQSAPSVATVNYSGARSVPYQSQREDSPSLSDHSRNGSKVSVQEQLISRRSRSNRSNSAIPSSDPNSSAPPTPQDGPSLMMKPVIASTSSPSVNTATLAVQPSPVYYDYSEDYQDLERELTEVFSETMTSPLPLGFVERIKALLEERSLPSSKASPSTLLPGLDTPRNSLADANIPEIAELPATPVSSNPTRRITRELILAALEPSSDALESSSQEQIPDNLLSSKTGLGSNVLKDIQNTPMCAEDVELVPDEGYDNSKADEGLVKSKSAASILPLAALDSVRKSVRDSVPLSCSSLASGMDIFIPDGASEMSVTLPLAPVPKDLKIRETTMPHARPSTETNSSPILVQRAPVVKDVPLRRSILRTRASSVISKRLSMLLPSTVTLDSTSRFSIPASLTKRESIDANSFHQKHDDYLVTTSTEQPKAIKSEAVLKNQEFQETIKDDTFSSKAVSPLGSEIESCLQSHTSPISFLSTTRQEVVPAASRDSVSTTHLSTMWPYRKPVATASINTESPYEPTRTKEIRGDNTTTDLRFSLLPTCVPHLPDVKEEPNLESCMDLRGSGTFRFPLPRGSTSFKMPFDEKHTLKDFQSGSQLTPCQSVFKPSSTALMEAHIIPSLNFSSINLVSKLNESLQLCHSSTYPDLPELLTPTPDRVVSSGEMRERYRSFFRTLDDMTGSSQLATPIEADDQPVDENDQGEQEQRQSFNMPTLRPLSPDELIDEVNRISVPSVNALTQRLSELLPSLKRYYGDDGEGLIDEAVKTTINEIRELGKADQEEELQDSWNCEQPRFVGELSDYPEDQMDELQIDVNNSLSSTTTTVPPRPLSVPVGIAELEAPLPSTLRIRSLSDGDVEASFGDRFGKLARLSHRSLLSSVGDTRPWNLDTSYPWANSAIDIGFPSSSFLLRRDATSSAVTHHSSRLRLRVSDSDNIPGSSCDGLLLNSPQNREGPLTSHPTLLLRAATSTKPSNDTTYPVTTTTRRKTSKRSILGSFSRKILPLSAAVSSCSPVDHSGFATSPDILRGEDRNVDPGDRYPTTGLSPPGTLHLDEVQSFFSDDSEATVRGAGATRPHGGSFRKRFTSSLRAHLPGVGNTSGGERAKDGRPVTTTGPSHGSGPILFASQDLDGVTGALNSSTASGMEGELPAAVMSRSEVRARKLVERFKFLLWRGGELLRSMSGRRQPEHVGDDEDDRWSEEGASAFWGMEEYDAGAIAMLGRPCLAISSSTGITEKQPGQEERMTASTTRLNDA